MESVRESVVTSMYIESRRDSSLKQMSLALAGIKKSSLIQRVQQWRANLNQAVELGQESRLEWLENDVMQSDFKKFELNEAYKKRLLTGVVNHMRNRDTMKAITAWRSIKANDEKSSLQALIRDISQGHELDVGSLTQGMTKLRQTSALKMLSAYLARQARRCTARVVVEWRNQMLGFNLSATEQKSMLMGMGLKGRIRHTALQNLANWYNNMRRTYTAVLLARWQRNATKSTTMGNSFLERKGNAIRLFNRVLKGMWDGLLFSSILHWQRNMFVATSVSKVKKLESMMGQSAEQAAAEQKRLQKQRNIAMMKLEAVKEDEMAKKLRQILVDIANKYGAAGGFTADQLVSGFM